MITSDQLFEIVAIMAAATVVVGLGSVILIACLKDRRTTWYRCPICGRWQDQMGNYGRPPTNDHIGGANMCSHCERRERMNPGMRADVSDAELARKISGPHAEA